MMVVRNEVRKGFYLDSVSLMRSARALTALPGIEEAGLMIGTPSNKGILREAGVLNDVGEQAGPGDLIIALRASSTEASEAAMVEARRQLDRPRGTNFGGTSWRPHTLRGAMQQMPDANSRPVFRHVQVFRDRIFEREFLLFDQHHDGHYGELLSDRA